jgi:hypothetical protein
MFGPFVHPKPESRRAVPELIAEHRYDSELPPGVVLPSALPELGAPSHGVSIVVEYRLREYLAFLRAHLVRLRPAAGRSTVLLLYAGGCIAFWIKRRRMGRCTFTFDEAGIRRRSRRGESASSWIDVVALHDDAVGLSFEKKTGAYPIPARCLTPLQRQRVLDVAADGGIRANRPLD